MGDVGGVVMTTRAGHERPGIPVPWHTGEEAIVKDRVVFVVMTLLVGLLANAGAVHASNHLITYRFEGPVSSTVGGTWVTGSVVFDPSVPAEDIAGSFDLGDRVVYRGAARSLTFTIAGVTRQLVNGDIQVWNDYDRCIAQTVEECLQRQSEPDRISFEFGPVNGEDGSVIAQDQTRQMLSSVVLPAEPPTGAAVIRFDWETSQQSVAGNVQWVYEREIDIRPDSDRNPINLNANGLVPVAVLGSTAFDVSTIEVATLAFGPSGASPLHGGHLQDVNDDGLMDLLAHFASADTGIQAGDLDACLWGDFDAGGFMGCDSITTRP